MKRTVVRNNNGQGIIELAFLLPLILLLALGVFEFGRAIHAKNITINMSREAANLYERTSADTEFIMDAVADTSQPLKMSSNGCMYLIKVQGRTDGPIVVEWDRWNNCPISYIPVSRVGNRPSQGNPAPPADIGNLVLNDGEVAYIAEVFYKHPLIFSRIIQYTSEVYSRTIM